jgi:hypothetical protein
MIRSIVPTRHLRLDAATRARTVDTAWAERIAQLSERGRLAAHSRHIVKRLRAVDLARALAEMNRHEEVHSIADDEPTIEAPAPPIPRGVPSPLGAVRRHPR